MPSLTTSTRIGAGRVVLILEYDGSKFYGWQSQQAGLRCVETLVAKAVSQVANHPVELVCAGRTDAGVHASHQVVHFDTSAVRSERSWVLGINTALPADVSLQWVTQAPATFHARFSAVSRRYRYIIYNRPVRTAHLAKRVTWHYHRLDADLMHQAAQLLLGEQDFSAFRASGCQSRTPNRNIHFIQVARFGDYVVVDVQANAFLHHMVRNITGSLMRVGQGEAPVEWIAEVLAGRDRRLGGVTAPPDGLYLVDVNYPDAGFLPANTPGPHVFGMLLSPEKPLSVTQD